MEEKKICPLMSIEDYDSCVKERCALWNKTGRCCTFASMAWSLRRLIAAVNKQTGVMSDVDT